MKLSKKILSVLFLALFAFAIAACNGEVTTSVTTEDTQQTTTEEVTTQDGTTIDGTTEETTTGDGTTAETTEDTDPGVTGEAPEFLGLFTKQSYYVGSRDYDILEGVTVIDEEDGEISADNIRVAGAYSLTRPGSYTVYAVVEDSDGNVTNKKITIVVKELSKYSIPETLTSDPIEIDLWHSNGATIENALIGYAEDFQDLYSNITVNIIQNGNNYDELRQNVINAIRGGEIPNIVQNYPDHVMEYIDNNAVIPLTPFIYHSTHGYNPSIEQESFLDIILSYRRENSQYTTDGEFYSLPFNKSTEVMIYNKTMMDALIADGTITEVPETWQDLFAIADDLRRVAINEGIIDDIAFNLNQSTNETLHKDAEDIAAIKSRFVPIAYDSPANAFITLTRQWGGQYTSINAQREGVILFDNLQTRDMLSYFYDNRDDGVTAGAFTIPGRWGIEYGSDAFKIGQTAITFGSTGGARYNTPDVVDGDYVFEFGVAPMPYNADMPENRTAIQQGTNMSITTAGNDQEKLASWLFLKYLTSYEIQLDFALVTGYSPVRNTIYSDSDYVQFTDGLNSQGNPLGGEMLMKSRAAQAAALQADILFYDQAFVGSSAARDAVDDAFSRVILGTSGTKQEIIDDAIASAKSEAELVLGN